MIGQHVVDTRRPLGLRERGVYEAVYKDAVLYQGRYPVASVARVLLDKGLAAPEDTIVATRRGSFTRRGNVGRLALRIPNP